MIRFYPFMILSSSVKFPETMSFVTQTLGLHYWCNVIFIVMTAIPESILKRKGVRKAEDIPTEVLQLLNTGQLETANLTEWLAVDQLKLLELILNDMGKGNDFNSFAEPIRVQKKPTANSNTKLIGQTFGLLFEDDAVFEFLRSHPSDVVRCWGCWAESLQKDSISDLLTTMLAYAADRHFGVREVVIFATKERLAEDLNASIDILSGWTSSEDENVRRYTAEVLRPIGVWTKKIGQLQETPEIGLPLLTPLKSDASKYVQNSVANWLNDASKSNPEWVRSVCDTWKSQSDTKETSYIIKRALRSIDR